MGFKRLSKKQKFLPETKLTVIICFGDGLFEVETDNCGVNVILPSQSGSRLLVCLFYTRIRIWICILLHFLVCVWETLWPRKCVIIFYQYFGGYFYGKCSSVYSATSDAVLKFRPFRCAIDLVVEVIYWREKCGRHLYLLVSWLNLLLE